MDRLIPAGPPWSALASPYVNEAQISGYVSDLETFIKNGRDDTAATFTYNPNTGV